MSAPRRLVVGWSGASGAIYGQRFVQQAARFVDEIYLILSSNVADVARTELGIDGGGVEALVGAEAAQKVRLCDRRDFFTPPASGSFRHDGMAIVPCSMGTAGRIAAGVSDDLMTRAADVCLKERRRLVLVVRETPLSAIHLENLTRLAHAGATILPAVPAFYHQPKTIEDLVDTVVARALQQFGFDQDLVAQWQA